MKLFDFVLSLNMREVNAVINNEIQKILSESSFVQSTFTHAVLIYENGKDTQIIITPTQYIFKIARECDIQDIKNNYKTIKDITKYFVGTTSPFLFTVHFIEIVKMDKDLFSTSLHHLDFPFDKSNIKGVGYRFFIENGEMLNEFRVEPLVKDPNCVFYEGQYQIQCGNIETVDVLCESAYNDFVDRCTYFDSRL